MRGSSMFKAILCVKVLVTAKYVKFTLFRAFWDLIKISLFEDQIFLWNTTKLPVTKKKISTCMHVCVYTFKVLSEILLNFNQTFDYFFFHPLLTFQRYVCLTKKPNQSASCRNHLSMLILQIRVVKTWLM